MLDLRFVRENADAVRKNLENRHTEGDVAAYVKLYDERKDIIQEGEQLKAQRNAVTAEISALKRNKQNADDKIAQMKKVGDDIAALDEKLRETENALMDIALRLPNMCDASVPVGNY